jgi:hypothetical protein
MGWKARKAINILSIMGMSNSAVALEKTCYDDWISKVSRSGDIVVMSSGHVYQIDSFNTFDTVIWLPAEEVLICETTDVRQGVRVSIYDIINTDAGGGSVWAQRLK